MLSPQQITARRQNSLKSTGPRTPQGKSASSRNALKTGIGSNALLLPGEFPDLFAALTAAGRSQYPDASPAELVQIDATCLNYCVPPPPHLHRRPARSPDPGRKHPPRTSPWPPCPKPSTPRRRYAQRSVLFPESTPRESSRRVFPCAKRTGKTSPGPPFPPHRPGATRTNHSPATLVGFGFSNSLSGPRFRSRKPGSAAQKRDRSPYVVQRRGESRAGRAMVVHCGASKSRLRHNTARTAVHLCRSPPGRGV